MDCRVMLMLPPGAKAGRKMQNFSLSMFTFYSESSIIKLLMPHISFLSEVRGYVDAGPERKAIKNGSGRAACACGHLA
ncbi:MAG TPA: hypothetical protein DEB31_07225 [Clostridiales bacterium]|nr:hypothetical protein [Clostridiales bacterium]